MIEIREAKASEHETLTAVAHAAKRFWGYPEEWIELWRPQLTFSPDDVAEMPTFCAVVDQKVVGVCAVRVRPPAAELEHLWVLPGFMGQGVGRALFERACAAARERGADHMRIESDPNAVDFYRKVGSHQVGEVPGRPEGRRLPLFVIHLAGEFARGAGD